MDGSGRSAGVLAIWHDCAPGAEREYEHWYRAEHLPERVGVDGFVAGFRYRAEHGEPGYFTHYETAAPEVLFSRAYRERVDAPTPLTRRVMDGILINQTRTPCERVLKLGAQRGALAVTLRFDAPPGRAAVEDALGALAGSERVLRAELWMACDVPGEVKAPSAEQRIRGPDRGIAACALLECATLEEAREVLERARTQIPGAGPAGIYRLLCSLQRADLAG